MYTMPGTERQTEPARCYSYIRFSSADQRRGDSLRRQTEDATAWAARNGLALDDSTTLHDLGRSAFKGNHRLNPDRNALAAFLKLVEDGKVPRGSFLLLESLDRLTREHIRPALTLLLNLIEAGIRVVQLKPVEIVYDDAVEPMTLMMALMELSRGNSESKVKSQRVGAAYEAKREHARAGRPQRGSRVGGMEILTHQLPKWITEKDGKAVLRDERATVVRRIFELAGQTHGSHTIVKMLTAENVPAFTKAGRWSITYVTEILTDRRALGEYQPTRDGKPDGKPIENYYPAAVSKGAFISARAAARVRHCKPGRIGERVSNLFTGKIRDMRGGNYWASSRLSKDSKGQKRTEILLFNGDSKAAKSKAVTFVYRTFERAVLAMLDRVDPDAVFGRGTAPALTPQGLRGELDFHNQRIEQLGVQLATGNIPEIADRLRREHAAVKDLEEQLGMIEDQTAMPLRDSLRDVQNAGRKPTPIRRIRYEEITTPGRLLAALDAIPADQQKAVRLELRAHLSRVIDCIHLLVLPKGKTRFASVQIVFAAPAGQTAPTRYLDLVIVHKAAQHNGRGATNPGRLHVYSKGLHPMTGNIYAPPADGPVLTPEQLEKRLSDLPIDAMEALEPEGPAKSRWTWTEEIPAKTC
jgi:DNA invertase Pin-like site-specific DNA recombinase